jgi:hypothetical protein
MVIDILSYKPAYAYQPGSRPLLVVAFVHSAGIAVFVGHVLYPLAIYSCPSDSTAIKHIDIAFIDKNYRENKSRQANT